VQGDCEVAVGDGFTHQGYRKAPSMSAFSTHSNEQLQPQPSTNSRASSGWMAGDARDTMSEAMLEHAHSVPQGLLAAAFHGAQRERLARLLLQSLEGLPRVWVCFKPHLVQRLWDVVCPLLKLSHGSSFYQCRASRTVHALAAVPALDAALGGSHAGPVSARDATSPTSSDTTSRHGSNQHGTEDQACPQTGPDCGIPSCTSHHGLCGPSAGGHDACLSRSLCGPLVELCSLPDWSADWWTAWTAPAMAARVTPLPKMFICLFKERCSLWSIGASLQRPVQINEQGAEDFSHCLHMNLTDLYSCVCSGCLPL
jgi:hypothetical protein